MGLLIRFETFLKKHQDQKNVQLCHEGSPNSGLNRPQLVSYYKVNRSANKRNLEETTRIESKLELQQRWLLTPIEHNCEQRHRSDMRTDFGGLTSHQESRVEEMRELQTMDSGRLEVTFRRSFGQRRAIPSSFLSSFHKPKHHYA